MIMVRVMGCCSCSISIHLIVAIEECCRSVVLVLLLSLFFCTSRSHHISQELFSHVGDIYISVFIVTVHSVLERVAYT